MVDRDVVSEFLNGVESGHVEGDLFSDDVVLDATVPEWRFKAIGRDAVRDEFAEWYADPGHFETLSRRRVASDGDVELIEFFLTWQEKGVAHGCHQAHVITVSEGRISAHTAFCGGRWPQPLMDRMGPVNVPVTSS